VRSGCAQRHRCASAARLIVIDRPAEHFRCPRGPDTSGSHVAMCSSARPKTLATSSRAHAASPSSDCSWRAGKRTTTTPARSRHGTRRVHCGIKAGRPPTPTQDRDRPRPTPPTQGGPCQRHPGPQNGGPNRPRRGPCRRDRLLFPSIAGTMTFTMERQRLCSATLHTGDMTE